MRRLRFYGVELVLVAILAGAVFYFGYLGYGLLTPSFMAEPFSGTQALAYAEQLASYGDRSTGSSGNTEAGDWLIEELRRLGWDVVVQQFRVGSEVEARNIVAIRSGGATELPVGILSTHIDTRLYADSDPAADNQTQPTPGANAGASGAAVLLELARTLEVVSTGHTVCLAFFDAEENGEIDDWEWAMGSAHFLRRLDEDIQRCRSPRFAIYLDMVGANNLELQPEETGSPELMEEIWRVASDLGYGRTFRDERPWTSLDAHTRFANAGIPSVTIADSRYRHRYTTNDTVDKLRVVSLERVGQTLKFWLERGAAF